MRVLGVLLLAVVAVAWGWLFLTDVTCDNRVVECSDEAKGRFLIAFLTLPALPAGLLALGAGLSRDDSSRGLRRVARVSIGFIEALAWVGAALFALFALLTRGDPVAITLSVISALLLAGGALAARSARRSGE